MAIPIAKLTVIVGASKLLFTDNDPSKCLKPSLTGKKSFDSFVSFLLLMDVSLMFRSSCWVLSRKRRATFRCFEYFFWCF